MKGMVVRWLILTVAILAAAHLIDGIRVSGFFSALLTAAVLGVLNALLRPILLLLTLPLNLLTLGLFTFAINAALLMMASGLIRGFAVEGFGSALLGSLLISAVSWLLTSFISGSATVHTIDLQHRGNNRWE